MKTLWILPGEGPFMWVGVACEALSPKWSSNVEQMHKGSADEAVVVVKQDAEEDMVTY